MPIRKYNPTSPGRRFQTVQAFDEVTTSESVQAADRAAAQVGRAEQPRRSDVVVARRRAQAQLPDHRFQARQARHSGDGGDRRVRPEPVVADCAADVCRRREALHPAAARPEGRATRSSPATTSTSCRGMRCRSSTSRSAPQVHNVELRVGKGGQIARSAGSSVQVVAKDGDYASVKMPSGEIRKIHAECLATIGQVGQRRPRERVDRQGGPEPRWMGKRPHVRGVAMNPVDHPLGGGEGKTSGGRHPVSPWGQPTKGYKTRNRKVTDRFIVQRRKK